MNDKTLDLVVVIDLDRTIFDTTHFVEILYREAMKLPDFHANDLNNLQKREQRARGQSFDVVGELRAVRMMPSQKTLIDYADQMLYLGVQDLFRYLETQEIHCVVLTYGKNEAQLMKLRILEHGLGRRVSFHITQEKDKAAWLKKSNHRIPDDETGETIEAAHIILIDDKQENLVSDDPYIYGIHVDNTSEKLVDSTVRIADTLPLLESYLISLNR